MVAYRQRWRSRIEFETRYIKQSGGRGKYAVILMKYEPLSKEMIEHDSPDNWKRKARGEKPDPNNVYFVDEVFGGAVPREYIPSVEPGLPIGCAKGAKYGFRSSMSALPCWTARRTMSIAPPTRSNWPRSRVSRRPSRRGALILEPIMNVVVLAPSSYRARSPATSTAAAATS